MEEISFSIEIDASKEKVWDTLWQDETFREWAGIIDSGTYIKGELKEGNEIQFISEGGYGVTSFVEKLIVNEFLLLRHLVDTQDEGKQNRDKEWTGGKESYRLAENDGITTLMVIFDVPLDLKKYFEDNYPKAMKKIKELAEK